MKLLLRVSVEVVVVNKRITLSGLVGLFLVVVFSVVFVSTKTFAGTGGNMGGGGVSNCGGPLNTCYGATWRYYSTSSDDVYIKGWERDKHYDGDDAENRNYAAEGRVTGCKKYRGYWRYAMVASRSTNYYNKGDQFGLIGIGGNEGLGTYNSEFFYSAGSSAGGAHMNYISSQQDSRNGDWAQVYKIYYKLHEQSPQEFPLKEYWGADANANTNWYNGLAKSRPTKALSWFCGPDNIDKLDVKLTGVPVDASGNELSKTTLTGTGGDGGAVVWEKSTTPEGSATIGAGLDSNSTYFFIGWYDKLGGNRLSKDRRYTVEKLTSNKTVYAVYERRSLEVIGKNVHDNSDITDGNNTTKTEKNGGWVNMERKNLNSSAYNYHFIGWKETASAGLDGMSSDTDTSKNVYVSDGGTYKYDNGKKDIYLKINANVGIIGNKTVYAYYTPSCKLNVYRGEGTTITIERISSKYDKPYEARVWSSSSNPTPGMLYKDDELRITFGVEDGYTLKISSIDGVPIDSSVSHTILGNSSGVCSDLSVSASAEKNDFEGRSRVGGDMSISTGWKKVNDTQTYFVDNCNWTNGCKVKFDHSLRRTSGSGAVNYSITRTYFGSDTENLKSNQSIDPGNSSDGKIVRSQSESEVTLYPGQVVCEELKFKPNGAENNVTLKVCASALGTSPSDDLISIKVKNEDVEKYKNYTDRVYAKPGDKVKYLTEYNPLVQYAYATKPQQLQINNNAIYDNALRVNLGTLFNNNKGNLQDWNNGFTVYSEPSSVLGETNYPLDVGSIDKKEKEKEHSVSESDVGKELIGHADINKNNVVKSTPIQVAFVNNNGNNLARVTVDKVDKNAKAVVPYNFKNEIKIVNDEKNPVVYAGATKSIYYQIKVREKTNSETTDGSEEAAYATNVPEAKVRLVLSYNGKVSDDDIPDRILKDVSSKDNDKNRTPIQINIKDVTAGTELCVEASVYPATSGEDTNWDKKEGDGNWSKIDKTCFTVAKRPSFQVWGGGVYSNGNIAALDNTKNNLAGVPGYEYTASNSNNKVAFGSWAEQAVVANGAVKGLTSGAATGLNFAVDGNILNGIAENNNEDYCDRVPLSFANRTSQGCPNDTVTGYLGAKNNELDRKAFINYVIGDTNASVTKLTATNDDGSYSLNSDILNDASLIEKSRTEDGKEIDSNTRVVMAAGNNDDVMVAGTIVINSNLQYEDYKTYTGLSEIPKLIIYADNISIACNVTRIDAILIANGKVDTCPTNKDREDLKDGDPVLINNPENSTQLTINGMIITNQLDLNRTYGAATGINSGIPAEIINYDASTILWSMNQIDTDNYAGMSAVYQHEIAPRY